ncbi:MAG: Gfo/Idh/MocA family oxidoreductase [Alkalispirochaeta sp.]
MNRIRWGIIGCGDVTEKKSGPGFQKARGSELVAVMRRNREKAADYARRHGVPRWYDDADSLINDGEVDAVYIATHPDSHREYALRTIAAGKPVYIEKPMGFDRLQGEEIVAAGRDAGVPVFVAYYRRAMEKYVHVRKLLREGTIGDVRFVRVLVHQRPMVASDSGSGSASGDANLPWRLRRELSGGGLIMDVGSHGLDLLDFYLGPIAAVDGFAGNLGNVAPVEDTVCGAWVFESGVHGSGVWCFSSFKDEDSIEIVGSHGRITFSVLDVPSPVVLETDRGEEVLQFEPPEHVQQPLIQTVVDELLGQGTCPSTGESAARTDLVLSRLREATA